MGSIGCVRSFKQSNWKNAKCSSAGSTKTIRGSEFCACREPPTRNFFELIGHKSGVFSVRNLQKSDVELQGDVVEDADGSVRHVRITRADVGAKIEVDCPCLMRQEFGLPCARAMELMVNGGWCERGLPVGCVSDSLTCKTWEMQCAVDVMVPAVPAWLSEFDKANPASSLRMAVLDGSLVLVPGRIPAKLVVRSW